jgi:hypothetical protein
MFGTDCHSNAFINTHIAVTIQEPMPVMSCNLRALVPRSSFNSFDKKNMC